MSVHVTLPGSWWMWLLTLALGGLAGWLFHEESGTPGGNWWSFPIAGCLGIVTVLVLLLMWGVYAAARHFG